MPVEWAVQATEFANCNCAYGCGCQFNALPDKGFGEAVAGYQITRGHFGDVQLDGLRAAALWHFPGAVHEGNGTMQLIIDERAESDSVARRRRDNGNIRGPDCNHRSAEAAGVSGATSMLMQRCRRTRT
jgi:hypothetical protein